MKILYFELNSGAAGDMLNAAMYELLSEEKQQEYLEKMASLLPGKVKVKAVPDAKCQIIGTGIKFLVDGKEESPDADSETEENHEENEILIPDNLDMTEVRAEKKHEHHHRSFGDVRELINGFPLSDRVKENAVNIYELIAKAESRVHKKPVDMVHFHEVGTYDAIMDVTGACLLVEMLEADIIMASPVATGSGTVKSAHGVLPVPAPATEKLLQGIPCYAGECRTELTTPTGAAIIRYFSKAFGERPLMTVNNTGIGCGHKDLPQANVVRAFLGKMNDDFAPNDKIVELNVNLDDMTPEDISYAEEKIFEAGALEVFKSPVTMKKNRQATLLTVLCRSEHEKNVVSTIFHHTNTIGIRKKACDRYIMKSDFSEIEIEKNIIKIKTSEGYGEKTVKAEYEDVKAAAENLGRPIKELKEEIIRRLK